jgi:fatty aldehyde-generating acyl-ACP reductase
MDSATARVDFALIGHQDSWQNIAGFINSMRGAEQDTLSIEKIKSSFSFIPPRDIFRVKVRSATGAEINGVYIETFIDPDKLDASYARANIGKVMKAVAWAKKMGAGIVALGGFTSIVLEGNLDSFAAGVTKFTTGNTLTAAYIVKALEKAALKKEIPLAQSNVLVIGATGDIGTACVQYLKNKTGELLLCARNRQQLEKLSNQLTKENVPVKYTVSLNELVPEADIIISVASATDLQLNNCKKDVLICDAGYPKNLENAIAENNGVYLFHGGMGQVVCGFDFNPDYSKSIYRYEAPYIVHGCMLEAIVLAFENRFENYSSGKGNITTGKMEEIYSLGVKHGIDTAPFYNAKGLWRQASMII